jgi:hypothetical protein
MSEPTIESLLDADQQRTLGCVLDQIIPPAADAAMPGAGEIGLVEHIEQALRKSPDLLPTVADGLAAVNGLARDHGEPNFEALPESERSQLLEELSATHPGFLPSLIFHTYVGYYQNPRIVAALGMEAHPPFPKGFPMESGDLSLLDVVKQRPKMFREV